MISEKLTEEFIESHYFVLDKPYFVEEYDDLGFPTGDFLDFESGSEWEITNDRYLDGDIHLNGLTYTVWIEISEETFREYFSSQKWIRRREESCS